MDKKIVFKKFEAAVNDFNEAKLLKGKVTIDISKEDVSIVEDFMSAVERIPEGKEIQLPDSSIDMYNLIAEEQEKGKIIVLKDKPVEEEKKPKKVTGKKKKAEEVKEEVKEEAKEEKKPEKKATKKKSVKIKSKSAKKEKIKEEKKEEKKEEPKPEKKTVKKAAETSSKKKTYEIDTLGARVGSGTSTINTMFLKGATIEDIAEKVGSPIGRVKNHMYSLMKKRNVVFDKKKTDKGTFLKIKSHD